MKRIICLICFIASFALLSAPARAEAPLSVCINEICSSNGGHYTVEGSAPDYIELRNLTDQALALDGFFVSDDEDHLKRFSLEGYSMPENGYLILAADKKELPFKLSASGGKELFLSDESGEILQRVPLPPLEKDTTYSLQDSGEWQITAPSPLAANAEGTPYVKKVYVASPRFSHAAGFYDAPFDLTLEGYKTYQIYYTTDGSVPNEHSTPYTGPIHIEDATPQPNTLSMRTDILTREAVPPSEPVKKATIIRAVAIDPDGNRSNDVINTYFVGFQNYEAYQKIPVLSIVTDPGNLFDEQNGIYVRGKTYQEWLSDENRDQELSPQRIPTNYRMHGRAWEIPVSVQWFDAENALRLSQGAGLRIHGNWSREQPKKSFNLYARKEYGASTFQYDILAGLPGKEKLVVRTNLGKDSMIHALLRETGLPVSSYTPCLTFINGEFWGLYEIREKQDAKDIADFYGLNGKDLLVIKNKELDAGETPAETKSKGVRAVYNDFLSEISRLNSTSSSIYKDIDALIDVDNYLTCFAALTYLNNSDYRNNFTMWRTAEKGEGAYKDARWRWIFQDLDYCCYYFEGLTDIVAYLPEDVIFSALWKDGDFQTKFLTRVMDFANVELTPEYVKEFITPVLTYYNPYMEETDKRFPEVENPTRKPGTKEISNLLTFFKNRRANVIQQLTDTFQLSRGTSTLALNNLPDGIALEINGHQAHLYGDSWTGVYFQGCSVSFSAKDIPGYRFAGWYQGDSLMTEEQTVTVSTDADCALTPVYEELPVVVVMNESEILYGTGSDGFNKRLKDSYEECVLLPDATVTAERKYSDSSIEFRLDASVQAPQGFALSLPLHNYLSGGMVFTLQVPDSSAPLKWRVLYENGEGAYRPLKADCAPLSGGRVRISFFIPEEQLKNQSAEIRLEAEAENGAGSFSLLGFRVYGLPMGAALAQAHDYARTAQKIGADARYVPDFEGMTDWSDEEIEAETASLRKQLQDTMAQDALSTVGALGLACPALEGLDAYPAAVIDENLIQAFYNENEIPFRASVGPTVYLYEIKNNALRFLSVEQAENGAVPLSKRAGTFVFLDREVEASRFSAVFDQSAISDALLSRVFFDFVPNNHLWLTIETFTQYQEEISFDLPESWFNRSVFIYRAEGEELSFVAEKSAADGTLRIVPAEGRYLLLDEPVESFAEQAEWVQREIAELERIEKLERQKSAQLKKTLLLIGGALAAALVGGAVFAVLRLRKKKPDKPSDAA